MRRVSPLLLALAFFLLVALSGCGKSSFVPCCTKGSVYDGTEGTLLANPECRLADSASTLFGSCEPDLSAFSDGFLRCTPSSQYCSGGAQECARKFGCRWDGAKSACEPQSCDKIGSQQECIDSSCKWDASALPSGKCTGGVIKPKLPICVDDAPQSCVNNRCKAMMCGFTGLAPTPPPSSQDWESDPQQAYSSMPFGNIEKLPAGNLQGTSCTFATMNQRLYNQVKQSRGSLWVNSFRFGVGKSFSDFELSRNFFPQSDKFCSANPSGTVDRYFNYLNLPAEWCQQESSHYLCSRTQMKFTDQSVCLQYCGTQDGECQLAAGTVYACPESKFAYGKEEDCKKQCDRVANPNACTASEEDYPFLTEGARFKAKYVADYLVDTWSKYDFEETCKCKKETGSGDSCDFGGWDPKYHKYCDDFYRRPLDKPYQAQLDGPWWWASQTGGEQGELTAYFDARKFATLELDHEYYASELLKQYTGGQTDPYAEKLDTQLPFECSSSAECFSGRCDYNDYSRYPVEKKDGSIVETGCKVAGSSDFSEHLDCSGSYSAPVWAIRDAASGEAQAVTWMLEPKQSVKGSEGRDTNRFSYVVVRDEKQPDRRYPLFDRCEVEPAKAGANYCLVAYAKPFGGKDVSFALVEASASGECVAPAREGYVAFLAGKFVGDRYDVDFLRNDFGVCKVKKVDKAPYLQFRKMGWCAACTYSTLAVQEIDWMRTEGNGGDAYGFLRSSACYEWHGESAYSYSTEGRVKPDGTEGYEIREASVDAVRKNPNPDKGPLNGNIERDSYDSSIIGSDEVVYGCHDGWNGGNGWWNRDDLPYPSAPYLYDKLRNYLSSNVMPVLDVTNASTYAAPATCQEVCDREEFGECKGSHTECTYNTGYDPVGVCTALGGQGAEIFVVGSTGLLANGRFEQGAAYEDVFAGESAAQQGFAVYMIDQKHISGENLDGPGAVLVRTRLLKDRCVQEPLAAINIDPSQADVGTLIGTGDLSDKDNPSRGLLHKFFYSDPQNFKWRVKNGVPDTHADKVDLLLQEWYPTCGRSGSVYDRVVQEVDGRMRFSRALLGNLSKPSLVWRFHFPTGSACADSDGHYSTFMEYLFNNTGRMVDSGMIGIIYDSWTTESGAGWGEPNRYGSSGLSKEIAEGALDAGPQATDADGRPDQTGKKSTPFCEVQKSSRSVLGITKTTFGQKVFAADSACECTNCSDFDYQTGVCSRDAPTGSFSDQHYCNDGKPCTPPAEMDGKYDQYRCPYTCVNADNCELCSDKQGSSLCVIEPSGEQASAITKPYSQITDDYWEWVAGLPAKDKCCIQKELPDQPLQTYTYVARSGGKQRSEFLQYPARGEEGIDCGRTPDTSVLQYCGIKIPIASETFACWKVG